MIRVGILASEFCCSVLRQDRNKKEAGVGQVKSGRTAVYGDSFAICWMHRRSIWVAPICFNYNYIFLTAHLFYNNGATPQLNTRPAETKLRQPYLVIWKWKNSLIFINPIFLEYWLANGKYHKASLERARWFDWGRGLLWQHGGKKGIICCSSWSMKSTQPLNSNFISWLCP